MWLFDSHPSSILMVDRINSESSSSALSSLGHFHSELKVHSSSAWWNSWRSSEQEGANVDESCKKFTKKKKQTEAPRILRRKHTLKHCGEIRNFASSLVHRGAKKISVSAAMAYTFPNGQYILDTVVGSLMTSAAEGNLLRQDQNYEPLRKGRWNRVSPIDPILFEHPSGNSARVFGLSLVCGNARDKRLDGQVYCEMER